MSKEVQEKPSVSPKQPSKEVPSGGSPKPSKEIKQKSTCMSKNLSSVDARLVKGTSGGTKFKLFVQPRYVAGFEEPETISVSIPAGSVNAGPTDDRMYVVDAKNKRPYGMGGTSPQWHGDKYPPARPNESGHFDYLDINSREFSSATMYATVRRVLDIWENYFGHKIEWAFKDDFRKLELIPLIDWNNAQSGWGFLEFGYADSEKKIPYCQNFDVLAHELGHNILYTTIGFPDSDERRAYKFWGFHESSGDVVAMIASLHFNKMVDHVLKQTKGDLYSFNELGRLGEVSDSSQIRNASNNYTMNNYPGYPAKEEHALSVPLTGAIFDILVEVYQKKLVELGAISPELADRSFHPSDDVAREIGRIYDQDPIPFKTALLEARDYLGELLATAWGTLSPNGFTYSVYASKLLEADQQITGGNFMDTITNCFTWRKIQVPRTAANIMHSACAAVYEVPTVELQKETLLSSLQQVRCELEQIAKQTMLPGHAIPDDQKKFIKECQELGKILREAKDFIKPKVLKRSDVASR